MANVVTRAIRSFFRRSFGYDAAGGGRRWRGAGEIARPLAAMNAARGPISRRARYLVGNNALAASGVDAWTSALAGSGIKPQSAHPDPAVREQINALFEQWTDSADADGLTDFYGLQALAVRGMVTDGDTFALLSLDDGPGVPLRIRIVDSDQVDPQLHREIGGGSRIISGVEFDARGQRVAYHVFQDRPGLPTLTALNSLRVPAADILQMFSVGTPGQVRGLSWFAPILLRLNELDKAHDAQIMRQLVAAMLAGFITDTNGDAGGFQGETKAPGIMDGGLEPGTLKVLTPGQDIKFSEPANIGQEAINFLKLTAREIAAGLGLPYEILTGDLEGVNYSSIRAGLVTFRRRVEMLQYNILVYQFCRPIWRRFITVAVLSGKLRAPGFESNPELYLSARWITPKTDWVDPSKDVAAEIQAIGAGLLSRRQAVASRGGNIEELDREIASDSERAKTLGLDFSQKSSATASAKPSSPDGNEDNPGPQQEEAA